MTPEQAIKILNTKTSFEAIEELKYYAGFNRDIVVAQIAEAMNMGAEALRKQIPMKPIYEDYDDDGYGNIIPFVADCPVCGYSFEFGMWNEEDNLYCRCGQKIDWED